MNILCRCGAIMLVAFFWLAVQRVATAQDKLRYGVTWEFRVLAFTSNDEKETTGQLNELAADGWEYVGPLNATWVAFKRSRPRTAREHAELTDMEQLQGTWSRLDVKTTMSFNRKQWQIKDAGKPTAKGSFKLTNPGGDVRVIELLLDGKTIQWTYRIDQQGRTSILHVTYVGGQPKGFPPQGAWKRE